MIGCLVELRWVRAVVAMLEAHSRASFISVDLHPTWMTIDKWIDIFSSPHITKLAASVLEESSNVDVCIIVALFCDGPASLDHVSVFLSSGFSWSLDHLTSFKTSWVHLLHLTLVGLPHICHWILLCYQICNSSHVHMCHGRAIATGSSCTLNTLSWIACHLTLSHVVMKLRWIQVRWLKSCLVNLVLSAFTHMPKARDTSRSHCCPIWHIIRLGTTFFNTVHFNAGLETNIISFLFVSQSFLKAFDLEAQTRFCFLVLIIDCI